MNQIQPQENNLDQPHFLHRLNPRWPLYAGSVVGCATAIFAAAVILAEPPAPQVAAVAAAEVVPEKPSAFENVTLKARAAVVYDTVTKKTLYERNAHDPLPLASITKVMTALVAHESILDNERITISADALAPDGDSGLKIGETWRRDALIDYTLVTSSNDGAEALALAGSRDIAGFGRSDITTTAAFVAEMNRKAQALGLMQTHFENATGLDIDAETPGSEGSALDVAHLLAAASVKDTNLLEATAKDNVLVSSDDGNHEGHNTNEAVSKIPGLMGGKTGYTDLAGGNLGVVFDAGVAHPIVVVVLGSSYEDRFTDVEELVRRTLIQLEPAR